MKPERIGDVETYAWRRTDEYTGHSMARHESVAGEHLFHGAEVLAGQGESVGCWFSVRLDRDWTTTAVDVRSLSAAGERTLALRADAQRRWTRDGVAADDLQGCVDVDVAATPLTNTFPIRRLADVEIGESRTADVAWVDVPSLVVTRVEQTYRRLGPLQWEYGDPTHGSFVLDVDEDGVVTSYEGFATRV